MIRRHVWVQLVIFALVTLGAAGYGLYRFAGISTLIKPPYTVHAEFEHFGGIYPQAGVDLLGTPVGHVSELRTGPGSGTTVDLVIDDGVRIPADVTATVRTRSALGEQYVSLVPNSEGGPYLEEGSVIKARHTGSPPRVEVMLDNLNDFAASLPKRELVTTLTEMAEATGDLGPTLQRMLDNTEALTRTNLANLEDQTQLIDDSLTVLSTQVEAGAEIQKFSAEMAGLISRMRELNPQFAAVFAHGIQAGAEVVDLLEANQRALPVFLTNMLAVTDVLHPRLPQLRKGLVLTPWMLELATTVLRYCDEYDPKTGKPVPGTCHFDPRTGEPVWSGYLTSQQSESAGNPPYMPCTKGYERTKRYLPNGDPADGTGRRQEPDSPINPDVRCAAAPTDPSSPSVRGSQNAQRGPDPGGSERRSASTGFSLYDPNTGIVTQSDGQTFQISGLQGPPPPTGPEALGWLLAQPLS